MLDWVNNVRVTCTSASCIFSGSEGCFSPGSPMMMSAAQCVMLARSAARAERTETLKDRGPLKLVFLGCRLARDSGLSSFLD